MTYRTRETIFFTFFITIFLFVVYQASLRIIRPKDIFKCAIMMVQAGIFLLTALLLLAQRARQNTAQLVKMYSNTKHQKLYQGINIENIKIRSQSAQES